MKIIDAHGVMLNSDLLREALKDLPENAIARMHIAQEVGLEQIGITVCHAPSNGSEPPRPTMAGHVLLIDTWILRDRIRFEVDGEPVGGIVHLAIPEGMSEEDICRARLIRSPESGMP
jgi:hypothetical protein